MFYKARAAAPRARATAPDIRCAAPLWVAEAPEAVEEPEAEAEPDLLEVLLEVLLAVPTGRFASLVTVMARLLMDAPSTPYTGRATAVAVTETREPVGALEMPDEIRASTPLGREGMSNSSLKSSASIKSEEQRGAVILVAVSLLASRSVMLMRLYCSIRLL